MDLEGIKPSQSTHDSVTSYATRGINPWTKTDSNRHRKPFELLCYPVYHKSGYNLYPRLSTINLFLKLSPRIELGLQGSY